MGYWLGLELLGQLGVYRNPILLLMTIAALSFWGLMYRKDTQKNRRNFFYVFSLWLLVGSVFAMMEAYKKATDEDALREACADAKDPEAIRKGEQEDEDPDSCVARTRGAQQIALTFLIVVAGFIWYHLSMVTYTHW